MPFFFLNPYDTCFAQEEGSTSFIRFLERYMTAISPTQPISYLHTTQENWDLSRTKCCKPSLGSSQCREGRGVEGKREGKSSYRAQSEAILVRQGPHRGAPGADWEGTFPGLLFRELLVKGNFMDCTKLATISSLHLKIFIITTSHQTSFT